MKQRALFVLLACAACHPTPSILTVPSVPWAKTAIYVAIAEGRKPYIVVSDLSGRLKVPELARVTGQNLELYAFHYACPPDLLRIPPGAYEVVEGGHAIPPSRATYKSLLGDDGQSEWEQVDHPAIAPTLKIAREIKCAKFELSSVTIDLTSDDRGLLEHAPTFLIPLSEDEVLVSVRGIGFFRVTPASVTPVPEMNGLPQLAYYREREDRVWLFGQNNTLAVGDPHTGEFEMKASYVTDRMTRIRGWLAGPSAGAPFELFAFIDRNVLLHYDGDGWRELYRGEPPPVELRPEGVREDLAIQGGLVWLAPGEAALAWDHNDYVKSISTATVTDDAAFEGLRNDYFSGATYLPGVGLIVGTATGLVYAKKSDGVLVSFGEAPIDPDFGLGQVTTFAPLDTGLLIAGGLGQFTQLEPELDRNDKFCHYEHDNEKAVDGIQMPLNSIAHSFVTQIEEFGCGYVFLSRSGFTGDVEIGFLKRK